MRKTWFNGYLAVVLSFQRLNSVSGQKGCLCKGHEQKSVSFRGTMVFGFCSFTSAQFFWSRVKAVSCVSKAWHDKLLECIYIHSFVQHVFLCKQRSQHFLIVFITDAFRFIKHPPAPLRRHTVFNNWIRKFQRPQMNFTPQWSYSPVFLTEGIFAAWTWNNCYCS